jgi:hypothetical protein
VVEAGEATQFFLNRELPMANFVSDSEVIRDIGKEKALMVLDCTVASPPERTSFSSKSPNLELFIFLFS